MDTEWTLVRARRVTQEAIREKGKTVQRVLEEWLQGEGSPEGVLARPKMVRVNRAVAKNPAPTKVLPSNLPQQVHVVTAEDTEIRAALDSLPTLAEVRASRSKR